MRRTSTWRRSSGPNLYAGCQTRDTSSDSREKVALLALELHAALQYKRCRQESIEYIPRPRWTVLFFRSIFRCFHDRTDKAALHKGLNSIHPHYTQQ